MDPKQQYLTYAAVGRPRLVTTGVPLRALIVSQDASRGAEGRLHGVHQRIALWMAKGRAWTLAKAPALKKERAVQGAQPKLSPEQVALPNVSPAKSMGVILLCAGVLLGSLGWWSKEWLVDYKVSLAEKHALEDAERKPAPSQEPQTSQVYESIAPNEPALPLSLAETAQNEVIRVLDQPATAQVAAVHVAPAATPKQPPTPTAPPQRSQKVMPSPLPLSPSVGMPLPNAPKVPLEALEIEQPSRAVTLSVKPKAEEPPPRAVILDASNPVPERAAKTNLPPEAKPTPPAPAVNPAPAQPAKSEQVAQVVPTPQVAPSQHKVPVSVVPSSVAPQQPASAKKVFAEPTDITDKGKSAKPQAPSQPAPTVSSVTVVDVAQDGSYALITNPATRLPQRYAVGDKIYTGEVLKGIDPAKGRIMLDKRAVDME